MQGFVTWKRKRLSFVVAPGNGYLLVFCKKDNRSLIRKIRCTVRAIFFAGVRHGEMQKVNFAKHVFLNGHVNRSPI